MTGGDRSRPGGVACVMSPAPALRRCRHLALALLLSLALPSVPAAAGGAALSYDVWSNGSRVMQLTVKLVDGGGDYRVGLNALLVGPAAWFDDFELRTSANGAVVDDSLLPGAFRTESHFGEDKKVKWVELEFDAAGLPVMSSDPPFSPHTRPMVEAEMLVGSRDPLSAILSLLRSSTAAGRCVGQEKVYDGRRRFDLAMVDRGQVTLQRSLLDKFKGPAWRCAVELTPVAGYRFDGEDKTEVSSNTVLYLAEVRPDLPRLPVRIEAETGYGGIEIHLVKITNYP